jgi:hypothetical protein
LIYEDEMKNGKREWAIVARTDIYATRIEYRGRGNNFETKDFHA